jgi:hypothetical protein
MWESEILWGGSALFVAGASTQWEAAFTLKEHVVRDEVQTVCMRLNLAATNKY